MEYAMFSNLVFVLRLKQNLCTLKSTQTSTLFAIGIFNNILLNFLKL